MTVFSSKDFDDHETVCFVSDPSSGLRGIIAVHDTSLGPALGGCRMYPYASEAAALADVLRLSRGMSFKAAVAGVALGGGKSVIIGDPRREKSEALLRSMGRAIARMEGRYIAGEDIGTGPQDMRIFRQETHAVSCLEPEDGGYGDPAPLTALGVLQAIRAGLGYSRNSDDLSNVTVAVQGVGNVGYNLCQLLLSSGSRVVACDPDPTSAARAAEIGVKMVSAEEIYAVEADVFAPCAIGSTLNDTTIPQLRAKVVAGAANNQLAEERHAKALHDRGITYVPDYVANGGGLISCAAEWYKSDPAAIRPQVLQIFDTSLRVLAEAAAAGVTTTAAAERIARQRLDGAAAGEAGKRAAKA